MEKKKITHKDIFALVNSIQGASFETKGMQIYFQYIVDDRFKSQTPMMPKIKSMIKRFRAKADKKGLEYRVGNIRKLSFSGGIEKPSKQLRVGIGITKPRYKEK